MTPRTLRPLAVALVLVIAGQPAQARTLAPAYAGTYTLIAEPALSGDPLIGLIGQARTRVLVETYAINDARVITALANARGRGVDVRVMADPHSASSGAALDQLANQDVWWRRGNPAYALTGETAVVVDSATVAISTAPLTARARLALRRFLLVDHDSRDIEQTASIFYDDWERRMPARFDAQTLLAPVDYQIGLLEAIDTASRTLDIVGETLASPAIMQAATSAALRGVRVRVLLDPGVSPDVPQALLAGGVQPRIMSRGFAGSALGIDGRQVVIGSAALSDQSLGRQRELGVLLGDAGVVTTFETAFEDDWRSAGTVVRITPTPTPRPTHTPSPVPTGKRNRYGTPYASPSPTTAHVYFTPTPRVTVTPSTLTLTPSYLGSVRINGTQRILVSTLPGASVTITVTYPDGTTRNGGTTQGVADASGLFRDVWTIPPTTQTGLAHATVTAVLGHQQPLSTTIEFDITL